MKWIPAGEIVPPGLLKPPRNLVELLQARAEERPGHELYRYLRGGEREEGPWTRAEIQRRARGVAVHLRAGEGIAAGSRALLLFPAGLDFLAAFFGCLHAGVIAVPAPPPDPSRLARTLPRLQAIVRDSRPDVGFTDTATLEVIRKMADQAPDLAALRWVAIDGDRFDSLADEWEESWTAGTGPNALAYLQYTSGSTSSPKGVMVSHGNVLCQAECLRRVKGYSPDSRSVMWVPNFHDDGLVQGILEPLWAGGELVLLSPLDVVQQPLRWLRAMTRYRGTHGGGPNFMYELCVRRVAPEQREGLDLSSWEVAYNGAEPIREETRARFLAAYAPYGFRASALWSAYGMAESTLLISGGSGPQGAPIFPADRAALERRNRVVEAAPRAADTEVRPVVSCGRVAPGFEVVIVHPEKRVRCASDEVGEIWAAGRSNALGYWEKPEETEATFGARLVDDPEAGPFLRTGDLGFFYDGELYVTGRYKDLIIVGGRNLYPQDVELTVETSHPALRPGGVAAFAVDTPDGEALVVVQELDPRRVADIPDLGEVLEAIRAAVTEAHEAPVEAVVLIPPGTLPKTSSGKVQRRLCKADFLAGTQETVAVWRRTAARKEPAVALGVVETVSPGKSAAEIETWLVERLAAALNVDPREVEVDRPFARHKLDSRVALSLSGELEEWLGVSLSPTIFYEHPTVAELVQTLAPPALGGGSSPLGGGGLGQGGGQEGGGLIEGKGRPSSLTTEPAPLLTSPLTQPPPPRGEGLPLPSYPDRAESPDPIALIGWSCRFPGAPDRDAFRRLLWEGVDAIRELPEERRRLGFLQGLDPAALPSRGGFLEEVDGFDAPFFAISPREASTMDPQQRLLLEVSWEALESAGIAPTSLAGSPAGVFIGISTSDYANLQVRFGDPSAVEAQMGTGTSHSIAANRISYFLGLRGPSMAVDTACSSSLVAVHLACRSLRSGESRMALAGGVNLILWPRDSVIFTRAGMLAPDGRCKTFDASADGYSRGEGCGVVVLKRLSDALADGDPVLAVIRGSAVNQDGFSSGLTAPNGEAQQEVLRAALADAGLAPEDIGYVEAHGTGTALGDPIEVRALGAALREKRGDGARLRLGSVKTNFGHLEAAAGIAGLIKTVLILESGEIPPHLHLWEVNPHISLDEAGVEIPTRITSWPVQGGERRRAGVSSFGFGGTNAHVILEQAPERETEVAEETAVPRLFVLSARTPSALRALATRIARFLREDPASLADVCYTAAVGRAAFAHRLATVVDSRQQLVDRLTVFAASGEAVGVVLGKAEGRERPWVPDLGGVARDRAVLSTLAALWVRGGEVDGRALYAGEARRRVAMPTYPFERKGYWLELRELREFQALLDEDAAPSRPGLKPRATDVSPLRGDAPAQDDEVAVEASSVLAVLDVPAVLARAGGSHPAPSHRVRGPAAFADRGHAGCGGDADPVSGGAGA